MIAVSLNVGCGVRKPAKLCMCTQNTTKNNEGECTAPGVCGNGSVPLSHSGNVVTRIGTHTQFKDIFSYFSTKINVVTTHLNCPAKTVLMTGHNIHFKSIIWKFIPKLSPLTLLIWSNEKVVNSKVLLKSYRSDKNDI